MVFSETFVEGKALENFLMGFRSGATMESYLKKLRAFIEWSGIPADEIIAIASSEPRRLERMLLEYVEMLKIRGASGSTIRQSIQAVKHLLVMNDLENSLGWGKLSKMMPRARKVGLDRAPTKDEIRKLLEHADVRMRSLILLLASSGIRVGSVEHLKWRHVSEVVYGGYRFAKLVVPVSKGDAEAYLTFMTPEAYEALLDYRRLRESEGEHVTPDSPLIRVSKWSRTYEKGAPLPVSSKSLRNEIERLWIRAGVRSKGRKRHEFQMVHGFRKFFATRLENAGVGRLLVEILLGHKVSLASSYYKPDEKELMQAYAKAIPDLTLSEAAEARNEMQKRVMESNLKIAELERENIALQRKLEIFEEELKRLKDLVAKLTNSRRRKK